MNEKLYVSKNSKFLQNSLLSVIKGKSIRALDLEDSVSSEHTDTLLIYLSEVSNFSLNHSDLVLKIYGLLPQPKMVIMGLSLDFCYGQYLEALNLPDESTLDRKELVGDSEDKINQLINDPKFGFKNAIGQQIADLELERADFPKLNIKLDSSTHLKFLNISFYEDDEIEGSPYRLYLYYD